MTAEVDTNSCSAAMAAADEEDVPSGRHTPRILRALRTERADTCGSYTATLYDPENDLHSAEFQARLDRRNNDSAVSSDVDRLTEKSVEVNTAQAEDTDAKHVSFDDNLERVLEIPARNQQEPIVDDSNDEAVTVEIESFPPVKGAALKGKYALSRKVHRPQKKTGAAFHKTRETKSAQITKSNATVRRSHSERLAKRDSQSASSARTNSAQSRLNHASVGELANKKVGTQQRIKSSRHRASPDSHDNDASIHDETIKLSEFPLALLDSCNVVSDEAVTSARRLHAWRVANGAIPSDVQTPSISPMWHIESTVIRT